MTPQQRRMTSGGESALDLYKDLVVGHESWRYFCLYESAMLLANLPGAAGLGLRSLFFSRLFAECGSRPAIGRGISLKRPRQICLGHRVILDDYVALECRAEGAISIGDNVVVGKFSSVAAKESRVEIAAGVNIGSHTRVATQTGLVVGESTLIAAYAYIGPGNHGRGDSSKPLIEQEMERKGGVRIGAHVWIGARATILDGVTIGDGAIVGAHSLVREDVPAGAVAVGTPARIVG